MPRLLFIVVTIVVAVRDVRAEPMPFFNAHCVECHDATSKQGGLDLTAIQQELSNADNFAKWVKIHDRIESGEMPPKGQPRPDAAARGAVTKELKGALIKAEQE